jgi:hypothetical protein
MYSHNEIHDTHTLTVSDRRIPVGSVFDRVQTGQLDMKGPRKGGVVQVFFSSYFLVNKYSGDHK